MTPNSENILKEFLDFTNSLYIKDEQKLISYSFPVEIFDPIIIIDHLNKFYNDIFFFRNPHSNLTFIGLNSALEISETGLTNFLSFSEKLNYWKQTVSGNDDVSFSIFCCASKFDPQKKSVLWEDFESLRFHIPEFILFFEKGKVNGLFNFIYSEKSDSKSLAKRFLEYLNKFESLVKDGGIHKSEFRNSKMESVNKEFENWHRIFRESIKLMNEKKVEKLVLSREHSFKLNAPVCWEGLLSKLADRFPDCYLFFNKQNNSIFFGSSPEMFLKVTDNIAEVESVAGSAPRGEKSESDSEFTKLLQSSEKNHHEHLYVSKFISEILFRYSDDVKIIEEKQIRKLDNIQHLITRISAQLNSKDKLFELIDSLYPTPAVCGVPKEESMKYIRNLESHDRGLYSGVVGLFDFRNNCELAVSIRSALVKENNVTAFAGAGLVANSDCDEEFLETNLKLNTILSLFGNENKSK